MRRFCKGMVIFTHTKIAAVMLGGIMVIWSFIAIGPAESLFVRYLEAENVAAEWSFILFTNGLLLLAGSLIPFSRARATRHIGLVLCCFVMFAFGGFFFAWGRFTPVTVLMPYLGLMSLITLMAETKAKPRTDLRTGNRRDDCP